MEYPEPRGVYIFGDFNYARKGFGFTATKMREGLKPYIREAANFNL